MKYLTVGQYKRQNNGVAINDASDMNLAFMIAKAEAAIDSHMGFDPKRGGFEPHQLMMQQAFDTGTRKTFSPNTVVPIRQVTRYRIQVSNIGNAGAGFFANISSNDCVINVDGNYIEIVPLQSVTYALSPAFVELGLSPPIVELDVEMGYFLANFGEQLIDSGDHQTYYAQAGFWATTYTQALASQPNQLPPVPAIVYVDNVIQTTGYTVNAIEGSVTFTVRQTPTAAVSADYTHTIPALVATACSVQVDFLLSKRNLDKAGAYDYLYQLRAGEQTLSFPRMTAVATRGLSVDSPLCEKAANYLIRFEEIAIA